MDNYGDYGYSPTVEQSRQSNKGKFYIFKSEYYSHFFDSKIISFETENKVGNIPFNLGISPSTSKLAL